MKFAMCTKFQVNWMNCVESRRGGGPIDPPSRLRVTIFSRRLLRLIMCARGVATISVESFNRREGMWSKPTAFPVFKLRSWERMTFSEISSNLNGVFFLAGVLGERWLWAQADRSEPISRPAAVAKKLLKAFAMLCLSEERAPSIFTLGEVGFFYPGRIFFIVLHNDLWSPPLSSITRLLYDAFAFRISFVTLLRKWR